ncbi:MAG: alpha/beta hydrolase [Planctomycetota bacterium]
MTVHPSGSLGRDLPKHARGRLRRVCAWGRRSWLRSVGGAVVAIAIPAGVGLGTAKHTEQARSDEPIVMDLWPSKPPGPTRTLPPEADRTQDSDKKIAGRRIIKLGNVTTPQVAVYRAEPTAGSTSVGRLNAAVVVCPGGGNHILAYDLEGTEVAVWLNGLGITAIVLKYRVPFRNKQKRWEMAVQDGQRAMSLVRANAAAWGIDAKRIGMLGFSAGGELVGRVATHAKDRRAYERVDAVDDVSCRPDFTVLVYAAGLVDPGGVLRPEIAVDRETPPAFFVHTYDDKVSVLNALAYAAALKRAAVPAELHIYPTGGHGYGLRHVEGQPVTDWPAHCEKWFASMGV